LLRRVVKAIKHCLIVMVEDNGTKSKLRIGQGPPYHVGRSPILSSYISNTIKVSVAKRAKLNDVAITTQALWPVFRPGAP
jgi:hypothetical protein